MGVGGGDSPVWTPFPLRPLISSCPSCRMIDWERGAHVGDPGPGPKGGADVRETSTGAGPDSGRVTLSSPCLRHRCA